MKCQLNDKVKTEYFIKTRFIWNWQERGGGVFEGWVDTPMHTMI